MRRKVKTEKKVRNMMWNRIKYIFINMYMTWREYYAVGYFVHHMFLLTHFNPIRKFRGRNKIETQERARSFIKNKQSTQHNFNGVHTKETQVIVLKSFHCESAR